MKRYRNIKLDTDLVEEVIVSEDYAEDKDINFEDEDYEEDDNFAEDFEALDFIEDRIDNGQEEF